MGKVWCNASDCLYWRTDEDGNGICRNEMIFLDEEGRCEDMVWDITGEEDKE